jgi:hypothetical protein
MFTIQSMSLYLFIFKLYHARPCAHARLCMLFLIAFDCSDVKTLIGMINVGSTALTKYTNVSVSCCILFSSFLESVGCLLLLSQIAFLRHIWVDSTCVVRVLGVLGQGVGFCGGRP